jgi:hypothetical protein
VIDRLNADFVCTTVLIDDVRSLADKGDELAKHLKPHWTYPLEMIFLRPDGTLVTTLNSFKDFPGVHPDVAAPPGKERVEAATERAHTEVFLKKLDEHFPRRPGPP